MPAGAAGFNSGLANRRKRGERRGGGGAAVAGGGDDCGQWAIPTTRVQI